MKLKKIPYRLVLVRWEDSTQPIDSWQWIDNYTKPKAVVCVSVGFLIADTKKTIALAPNLGDLKYERHQSCGIIRIPKCCVSEIVDLAVKKSVATDVKAAV